MQIQLRIYINDSRIYNNNKKKRVHEILQPKRRTAAAQPPGDRRGKERKRFLKEREREIRDRNLWIGN
jgi:hypothetical protein